MSSSGAGAKLRRILCASLLCLAGHFLPPASAAEKVVLQLKWLHAFQFAGYYMADAKGYYRDAGLEVEIREGRPGIDVVEEVTSGRAQFGVGTSSLILARARNQPVAVLAAIFQHSPQVLIAPLPGPIRSVHDLVGRRVMLEPHAEELLAYLKRENVPLESIVQVAHQFDTKALEAGRVDAMSAYVTTEPFALRQAGVGYQTLSPRSAGIDFYGDNLFSSTAELASRRARAEAFRQASLRGWTYALDHPQEAIETILDRYPGRNSRAFLEFEAREMAPLVRRDLIPVGYMHEGRWRHIADTYAELGMLPRDFPFDDFLYRGVDSSPDKRLYLLIAAISAGLIVIAGIAVHVFTVNRRLKASQIALSRKTGELQLQNRVLELINAGTPMPEALHALVIGIEQIEPECRCSILLFDETGQRFGRCTAPSLPSFYNQAFEGLAIGDGVGSRATAAFRGEPVIVDDIRSHPYWAAFREVVDRTDLRSCWSTPFKDGRGKVLGTFAIYTRRVASPDATQRASIENYARLAAIAVEGSEAREAIRRSETRYRLIAENSNDVIWTLELPSLRFSYVSPSVERLRGWTAEEVMAQPMEAALTPDSARRVQTVLTDRLQRLAAGDEMARFGSQEVDQPCKDGSIVPTEVTTAIIVNDLGEPVQVVGITRNISERRRAAAEQDAYRQELERRVAERTEALLKAKDEAEEASRAKSVFLNNVSHELRTPMNHIIGLAEVLKRRITDAKSLDMLGRQVDSARVLLSLINNLIEIAMIGAGQSVIQKGRFTLDAMLAPVLEKPRQDAEAKGLAFSLALAPALGRRPLFGDALRLGKVLDNLLGNAVKFTEVGSVTLAVTEAAASGDAGRIRFEVTDTGIGIPEENLDNLFALFEQGDGSATRRYGGTGLGLALSRKLVDMMGGRIGLSSRLGSGCTVWFELPLEPPGKPDQPQP